MTVREALKGAEGELAGAGIEAARREASLLLAHVLGDTPGHLPVRLGEALAQEAGARFGDLVRRRVAREPLAYVTGETEFTGLRILCDRRALIPRPDTEVLVESVLKQAPAGAALIADLGTGTGCIAIALAHALPRARLVATDVSADALALAADNVALNGVQVRLLQGADLEPLRGAGLLGEVAALVANPPYIPEGDIAALEPEVSQAEPQLALRGGADGLDWYRRVAPELAGLASLELVAFEVGAGQARQVGRMLGDALGGWRVWTERDLGGIERVVLAKRA